MRGAGGQPVAAEVAARSVTDMTWDEFCAWLPPCDHVCAFTSPLLHFPDKLKEELDQLVHTVEQADMHIGIHLEAVRLETIS